MDKQKFKNIIIRNGVEFRQCKFYPTFRDPNRTEKMIRLETDGYLFCIKVGADEFELVAHRPVAIHNNTCQPINHNSWCISEAKSGLNLIRQKYKSLEDIAKDTDCRIIGVCAKIQNDEILRAKFKKATEVTSSNEYIKEY